MPPKKAGAKSRTKKSPAKARAKKAASAKSKADRWCLFATYLGEKQFRRGERVRLGCVGKGAIRVECFGPSQRKPGNYTVQWVKAEDLADLHPEWDSLGRKRAYVDAEMSELLQAAAVAKADQ